jgi:Tlde1 domain
MSWRYSQGSGLIASEVGVAIGRGYSGFGPGLNNPAMQMDKDVGPIPQGKYMFGQLIAHDPVVGEYAIPLIPDPANTMYSRADFLIHGDNEALDHTASHGCIVLPYTIRMELWESADHSLEVTA